MREDKISTAKEIEEAVHEKEERLSSLKEYL